MFDSIKSAIGLLWNLWAIVNNRPRVTFDVLSVYRAEWYPDWMHDEKGNVIGEGIGINCKFEVIVSNHGPVDTTLKDIHVHLKYDDAKTGRLLWQHRKDKDIAPGARVMPRSVWGPHHLYFNVTLWNVTELPQITEAELVIEPVAHKPVRRKVKLWFL